MSGLSKNVQFFCILETGDDKHSLGFRNTLPFELKNSSQIDANAKYSKIFLTPKGFDPMIALSTECFMKYLTGC